MGAEVIAISCDSKFVHMAWQREEKGLANVTYPMGADPSGELADLFGVYNPEGGYARRGTFLINPAGKLLAIEIHFDNFGRNIDELMRKFKANLHMAKNPAHACPAKWKEEGDATLTPGADLVGKVYDKYKE